MGVIGHSEDMAADYEKGVTFLPKDSNFTTVIKIEHEDNLATRKPSSELRKSKKLHEVSPSLPDHSEKESLACQTKDHVGGETTVTAPNTTCIKQTDKPVLEGKSQRKTRIRKKQSQIFDLQ